MKNQYYLENIIKNLGENFATEWIYAGGNGDGHSNYFHIFNKNKGLKPPPFSNQCQCTHDIIEQCYIYNPKTNELKVMGNCCIKKFVKKSGRTCERCGEPHKNRTDNYCKDCRKAIKDAGWPCEKCGKLHKNRKDSLCSDCREITCRFCSRPKKAGYRQCYLCYVDKYCNNSDDD